MAMARPNTTAIKKHKMVDQFQQLGLKSIINLQTPGIEIKGSIIYIFDGRSPSSHKWRFCIYHQE